MKPEDHARQDIDRQLAACGWIVQDRPSMNIHAAPGVAVREFPVAKPDGKRGSVDYLLYAGAKAVGVVEAKPRGLDPDARNRSVFTFHRPEELLRLVSQDQQLRHRVRHLPVLVPGKLWPVQVEAIGNLERSLAANRPRALIQMATGSGKTFTAAYICYRLVKFAEAKRILFLIDRNAAGSLTVDRQAAQAVARRSRG